MALAAFPALANLFALKPDDKIRIRRIISGPNFHWFGYYDKFQFDATGRWRKGSFRKRKQLQRKYPVPPFPGFIYRQ